MMRRVRGAVQPKISSSLVVVQRWACLSTRSTWAAAFQRVDNVPDWGDAPLYLPNLLQSRHCGQTEANGLQVLRPVSLGESLCCILILRGNKTLDVDGPSQVQSAHVTEKVRVVDQAAKQAAFSLVEAIPDDVRGSTEEQGQCGLAKVVGYSRKRKQAVQLTQGLIDEILCDDVQDLGWKLLGSWLGFVGEGVEERRRPHGLEGQHDCALPRRASDVFLDDHDLH